MDNYIEYLKNNFGIEVILDGYPVPECSLYLGSILEEKVVIPHNLYKLKCSSEKVFLGDFDLYIMRNNFSNKLMLFSPDLPQFYKNKDLILCIVQDAFSSISSMYDSASWNGMYYSGFNSPINYNYTNINSSGIISNTSTSSTFIDSNLINKGQVSSKFTDIKPLYTYKRE